jgi:hypothetical protein
MPELLRVLMPSAPSVPYLAAVPNDDLQLTDAELAKLQALQADVSTEMEARAERDRKLEEARKRKKAEQLALIKRKKELMAEVDADKGGELEVIDDEDDKPKKRGFLSRLFFKASTSDALEVASEARQELDKPKEKGKKSLLWSGGLSFFGGPLGWLYAGSFREAIPASAAYLAVASIVTKTGLVFLLMPAFAVGLGVSGIAGMLYAWQYNKTGKRQRLFGDSKKKKQLKGK